MIEQLKVPLLVMVLAYLFISGYLFYSGEVSVIEPLVGCVFALVLTAFKVRWQFDQAHSILSRFIGFRLGGLNLVTVSCVNFSYDRIKSLESSFTMTAQKKARALCIKLYFRDDSPVCTISTKVSPKTVQKVELELVSRIHRHGLSIVGSQKMDTRPNGKSQRNVTLDDETVKSFGSSSLFGSPVKSSFVTRTWFMPLPQQRVYRVIWPFYIATGLAALIFYSTLTPFVPYGLLMFGALMAALSWIGATNNHYFCPSDNDNQLNIDQQRISIPGIYFDDFEARNIDKVDITAITISWNWHVMRTGTGNSTHQAPFVFDCEIKTHRGVTAHIAGISLNSNDFVHSLFHLGYQAELVQVAKRPFKWLFLLLMPIVFYLIGMAVYAIYILFTGDYF